MEAINSTLANEILKHAMPVRRDTVAWEYLSRFNLNLDKEYSTDVFQKDLFHPILKEKFPALVYKLRNNAGRISRFMYTYLDPTGERAKLVHDDEPLPSTTLSPQVIASQSHTFWAETLKPDETKMRIAFNPLDALVLSDTVEKDCAVAVTSDKFQLPERVREVDIYCRHSESYRFEAIAFTLASKYHMEGIEVELHWPVNNEGDYCSR